MKINSKANLNFSKLSKDKNKIHLSERYAENFFIKKTITHGANLVLKMLSAYFKKYNNKEIKKIEINFTKPTYTNQEFDILVKKKSIFLTVNKVKNVEISINAKKANLNRAITLKKLILNISRIIGNHKSKPSLILKTKILKNHSKKSNVNITKIKKNIFSLKLSDSMYTSDTLFVKLIKKEKVRFIKKNKAKKSKKKVLIFGKNSDLGIYASNYLKSLGYQIYFFPNYYFTKKEFKADKIKLKHFFKNKVFDYIFYFISPKIEPYKKVNYNYLYLDIFKIIYDKVKIFKTKIFYPSTDYINNRNSVFKNYINSKKKAEIWISKNDSHGLVKIFRLPQIKSSQTYNLFGFYDGLKISILKRKINTFIQ